MNLAICSVLAVSVASGAAAQASMPAAERLDPIFAKWSDGRSPGCAIGIAKDGRPVLTRAYGLADLELNVPARPDSIYEAGSTSKQFTTAAIVLLARDGKLKLDDDVRSYIPELPDYGHKITLRHMIHHTSGLRDWGSVAALEGWPRNSRVATNDTALEIASRQRELNFTPGDRWLYSNTNYNLLAIVVQRVSGQSLADFSKARIFEPLGMARTRWRDDHNDVVPGRAHAYGYGKDGYHNDQVIEDAYGNGGLLTTVGDLLIWNEALDSDRLGKGFAAQMAERGLLNHGKTIDYAGALFRLSFQGREEIAHPGATGGYRGWSGRYPADRLSIAVLCNAGNANTTQIARQAAALFMPPVKSDAPYAAKGPVPSGLYVDAVSGIPLRFDGGPQGVSVEGAEKLVAVGTGRWRSGDTIYTLSPAGDVTVLGAGGSPIVYRKAPPPAAGDLSAYAGTFASAEVPGQVVVKQGNGGLTLSGPFQPMVLVPAYGDAFTADWATVIFRRDPSGAVTGLRISSARAYNVDYARQSGGTVR
ncbi:serine hydrolase [Brevundimonas diminuta]|uniref:serine hydrolase n=1 Tax=Brevundimonas diminuta TaxID=293 RepID=UPI0030F85C53